MVDLAYDDLFSNSSCSKAGDQKWQLESVASPQIYRVEDQEGVMFLHHW